MQSSGCQNTFVCKTTSCKENLHCHGKPHKPATPFFSHMRKLVWQGGMPLLTILVKICFLFYTAASLTNLTNTEVMRCQAQRLSSDNPFPLTHVYQLIHTHQDKVHPLLPKNTRLGFLSCFSDAHDSINEIKQNAVQCLWPCLPQSKNPNGTAQIYEP